MKHTIKFVFAALVLTLALAGCKPTVIPPKPTPTAAPTPDGVARPAGRIVTDGRVVPAKSVTLSFASGGIVAQAPLKVGQQVAAGEVLAQLETSVLELQLAQAEANLAAAQARLKQLDRGPEEQAVTAAEQGVAAAQAAYDRLVAGPSPADVAAAQAALEASQRNYADVRAGPSADELGGLEAQLASARAVLDQAQAAYDRVKSSPDIAMLPQSLALQQATIQYSAASAAYNAATQHPTAAELAVASAAVVAAQAALDKLTPEPAQVQAALAELESAKAQLAQLREQASPEERGVLEAGLGAAQASRDLAAAQLKNATLAAPFDGTVMKLDIEPGEYAAPGAPIVLLADVSSWQLETTSLTELNVADVSEGAPVTATFDAIPGLELSGHISAIEPYGETKQGDIVYTAIILLDRQDPRLRWNMTAKVHIG